MDRKTRDELFVESLARVFNSPDGKFILECLTETFHADEAPFVADPAMASYFAGQKSVVLFLKKKVKEIFEK